MKIVGNDLYFRRNELATLQREVLFNDNTPYRFSQSLLYNGDGTRTTKHTAFRMAISDSRYEVNEREIIIIDQPLNLYNPNNFSETDPTTLFPIKGYHYVLDEWTEEMIMLPNGVPAFEILELIEGKEQVGEEVGYALHRFSPNDDENFGFYYLVNIPDTENYLWIEYSFTYGRVFTQRETGMNEGEYIYEIALVHGELNANYENGGDESYISTPYDFVIFFVAPSKFVIESDIKGAL